MKKTIVGVLWSMAAACACFAETKQETILLPLGAAAAAGTVTVSQVSGMLDAVYVTVSDGVSTGTVKIAVVPLDPAMPAIEVATNAVVASKVWRPRVDSTDIAGAALTGDGPGQYILTGDSLRMIVTDSPAGKTWRATVKLEQ